MRFVLDARPATDHFPGIGRYASRLATHLEPLLQENERLLLLTNPGLPSRWQLPKPSNRVLHLPTAVSPFSLKQQWHIPGLLRRQKTAVYHSLYYLMPYWPGVPTIVTLYDLIPAQFPDLVSARARLLFQLTLRRALRTGEHFLAISESTRQAFLAEFNLSPAKITAIPLAADDHFAPQSEESIQALRQAIGLPEKYALYLGINKPHKNLSRLISAWSTVAAQLPHAPLLVIAGAWDERYKSVKTAVIEQNLEGKVRFLGPVPDEQLPELYSGALLFIFPSLVEGFGLPVLEAMACGTAVACATSASLPEVGGNAAAYFNPLNSEQMAAVIIKLLQDKPRRLEMKKRGLVQAQKFSWEKTAVATLAQYRQLATKTKFAKGK